MSRLNLTLAFMTLKTKYHVFLSFWLTKNVQWLVDAEHEQKNLRCSRGLCKNRSQAKFKLPPSIVYDYHITLLRLLAELRLVEAFERPHIFFTHCELESLRVPYVFMSVGKEALDTGSG